jgi:hypothetical protein
VRRRRPRRFPRQLARSQAHVAERRTRAVERRRQARPATADATRWEEKVDEPRHAR